MTQFVIDALMKLIVKHKLDTSDLTIGVFGIAYKENVPDIRNSLSLKLIKELHLYGLKCCIHDPLVSKTDKEKHNIKLEDFDQIHDLSVAIIVVGHDFYQHKLPDILHKCKNPKVVIDIPNIFIDAHPQYKDIVYWNL